MSAVYFGEIDSKDLGRIVIFGNFILGVVFLYAAVEEYWQLEEYLLQPFRAIIWLYHYLLYPLRVFGYIWSFAGETGEFVLLVGIAGSFVYGFFLIALVIYAFFLFRHFKLTFLFLLCFVAPGALGVYLHETQPVVYENPHQNILETRGDFLKAFGYLSPKQDIKKPEAENAVLLFMIDHGLPETAPDKAILSKIDAVYSDHVKDLQHCMNANGFDVGKVDGVWGERTSDMTYRARKSLDFAEKAIYTHENPLAMRRWGAYDLSIYDARFYNHFFGCDFRFMGDPWENANTANRMQ
ncbi:MAG TPA: hypothetical protein DIW43_10435 [Spongiibacteraceae bacterium]|nr:hypothetical protein [Spongiibacteraceae bacterium]HCS27862.1 hypothetical protein [Spongiibacteraceae bacterium]|tara:strand:- start:1544 stop:2431 length:888 start_codon:yes stop_codon:yes gene_type:complete